jgi:two-component system, NarL family, nitrate/nitrite response regulator NarL
VHEEETMIRVVLVNAIRILCNVIAAVLENEPDIEIVGCATTTDEALDLARQCDVLVISTLVPGDAAFQITQTVVQAKLPIKVLILGLAESKAEILRYIEAGAAGYILQDDSVDDLLEKIRTTYDGHALVSPEIAAVLVSRVAELSQLPAATVPRPDLTVELTPREREILELIRQDFSNQEIAAQLSIEVGTVKNHVHNILEKLNVNSRRDAANFLAQIQ